MHRRLLSLAAVVDIRQWVTVSLYTSASVSILSQMSKNQSHLPGNVMIFWKKMCDRTCYICNTSVEDEVHFIVFLYISHLSTNFCPWTLRMIYLFIFLCLTHIYINILHWTVTIYYYGFLVNEGIGLILIIQTFYPSFLSVIYK